MKSRILSFFIAVILGIAGCADPCDDAVCLNGATCDDGTCICALGFTGEHCEIEVDPCSQVTCEPGQACSNGECFNLPVAEFSFVGNGCTAACSILFTNESTDATSYSWNFGDSGTSTSENPTHEYLQGNTYTVTLTATNAYGSDTHSEQVLIQSNTQQQLPNANFTISNNGCTAPCTIQFSNTSTNATSYSWNFGNGNSSTGTNVSQQYTQGGTYTVTLTATNQYGSDTRQQNVTINNPPTSVRITNVAILSAPSSDGGTQWDLDGGPDVFFDLETSGGSVVTSSSGNEYTNVTSYPISWNYTSPFVVNNLNQQYRVAIWDYDATSANDFMGQTNLFSFGTYTSYPSTITVTGTGVSVRFTVTWQ
jgi:PKD repeat protein